MKTEQEIIAICKKYKIENYNINADGSVDVYGDVDGDGDVDLTHQDLYDLPLKFGKVSGNFYCQDNKLTSLEGCPESVGGDFYCFSNNLTSLEGCPSSVVGQFCCTDNNINADEIVKYIVEKNLDIRDFKIIIVSYRIMNKFISDNNYDDLIIANRRLTLNSILN